MTNDEWDKILPLAERVFKLIDKWIDRKYPEQKELPDVEQVWKRGEPLPEPATKAEYDQFPSNQQGRFERAIAAARHDDSASG